MRRTDEVDLLHQFCSFFIHKSNKDICDAKSVEHSTIVVFLFTVSSAFFGYFYQRVLLQ